MGWQTDDGRHEGWAAAEFPGNRFSTGSGGGGARVWAFGPGPGPLRLPEGEPEIVDGREAIGWRGLCECGWRGTLHPRSEKGARPAVEPGVFGDGPEWLDEAIRGEWETHLEPEHITAVREHAQAVNAAQGRLTIAVHTAREAGASWADIGSAVGISKQSAHERWAGISRILAESAEDTPR